MWEREEFAELNTGFYDKFKQPKEQKPVANQASRYWCFRLSAPRGCLGCRAQGLGHIRAGGGIYIRTIRKDLGAVWYEGALQE